MPLRNAGGAAEARHRVFVVEDHPIVRQGLASLIEQEPDLTVCGEAEDARDAVERIAAARPDVVLGDISLRRGSGLDLIKDLRSRFPRLPVLVLSMYDESIYAERVLHLGGRGYIMKDEATQCLVPAIRRVLAGKIYISENLASRLMERVMGMGIGILDSPLGRLTDRELEVFRLIGRGRSSREIGVELHLSTRTVEGHRARIVRKLKLKRPGELILHAVHWLHRGMTPS